MATWYGCEPDQVEGRLSPYALLELQNAEQSCPWGEAAENIRMMYLANVIRAASDGYTKEGRETAGREAQRLLNLLLGPTPKRKPMRLKDLKR